MDALPIETRIRQAIWIHEQRGLGDCVDVMHEKWMHAVILRGIVRLEDIAEFLFNCSYIYRSEQAPLDIMDIHPFDRVTRKSGDFCYYYGNTVVFVNEKKDYTRIV